MTAAHPLTTSPSTDLRVALPSTVSDVVTIPYGRARRSALNPRKHFEHGPLVELAVSIYERTEFDQGGRVTRTGIEQNLIGRPDEAQEGAVEVAAGERRFRAVELLVDGLTVPVKVGQDANGRPIMGEKVYQVQANYPMPFRVREMTDAELIETATLENIMRAEMKPMEEADAFMALIGAGRTVDYIATRYRMHPATVESRIQLASGLGKEGRKLLDAGEIKLEQAKVIAATSGALKKSLLDHARSGSTATTLKNLLKRVSFPVSHALFDVEASGLGIEDESGLGLLGDFPARFRDPKAALSKQLEVLNTAKAEEEQKGTWGRVEVLPVDSEYANLPTADFVSRPDGMTPHLTLICATKTGTTGRSELYVRRAAAQEFKQQLVEDARREAQSQATSSAATPTSTAPSAAPAKPLTPEAPKIREAAHVIAHQTRAQAIQGKLATDPHTCLALACHALIDGYPRYIEISTQATPAVPLTPEGHTLIQELLPIFGTVLGVDDAGRLVKRPRLGFNVLDELLGDKVTTGDLLNLWTLLTHQKAGGWQNSQGNAPQNVTHLAARLGVTEDVQARFTMSASYLDAYTAEGLHALIESMPPEHRPVGVFKASKGDLVGLIMEKANGLKQAGWLPELVTFKK